MLAPGALIIAATFGTSPSTWDVCWLTSASTPGTPSVADAPSGTSAWRSPGHLVRRPWVEPKARLGSGGENELIPGERRPDALVRRGRGRCPGPERARVDPEHVGQPGLQADRTAVGRDHIPHVPQLLDLRELRGGDPLGGDGEQVGRDDAAKRCDLNRGYGIGAARRGTAAAGAGLARARHRRRGRAGRLGAVAGGLDHDRAAGHGGPAERDHDSGDEEWRAAPGEMSHGRTHDKPSPPVQRHDQLKTRLRHPLRSVRGGCSSCGETSACRCRVHGRGNPYLGCCGCRAREASWPRGSSAGCPCPCSASASCCSSRR